jgi:hypothetical protein
MREAICANEKADPEANLLATNQTPVMSLGLKS